MWMHLVHVCQRQAVLCEEKFSHRYDGRQYSISCSNGVKQKVQDFVHDMVRVNEKGELVEVRIENKLQTYETGQ